MRAVRPFAVLAVLAALSASSCALAPFSSTKSARPLGGGNWGVNAGFSPALSLSAVAGLTDHLDMGLTLEAHLSASSALWAKYALGSREQNAGFALHGGAFQSSGLVNRARGGFAGPVLSYRTDGGFEASLAGKYHRIDWDLHQSDREEDVILDLVGARGDGAGFLQTVLNLNFWFAGGAGLNVSVQHYSAGTDGVRFDDDLLPGIELMLRF